MFDAGNLRQGGAGAGRDADMFGAVLGIANRYGMRIDKTRRALDFGHAEFGHVAVVILFDIGDVVAAFGNQLRPVEAALFDVEAVTARILETVRKVGTEPHDFFRHTADVHTGSADRALFDHRAFLAVGRGAFDDRQPAAAGAEGN